MSFTPITPIPVALRTMPQPEFDEAMAGFMTQLSTYTDQMNVAGAQTDANATSAAASAATATAQAASATASATAAANSIAGAGVIAWVSGTTYAVGNVRYSPIDFRSYRRITAGAGTTDPSLDPTNWLLVSYGPAPILHVRDEKAAGTGGGTSVATDITQSRTINTTKTNTIVGASLASDTITMPAGTYDADITAPAFRTNSHQAFLYNTSDSTYTLIGTGEVAYDSGSNGGASSSRIRGRFTITASKTFKIRHYTTGAISSNGLGVSPASGQVAVYTDAIFVKVA